MEKNLERPVIIITENCDPSANKVMEWLHFYKKSVIRKNNDTDAVNFSIIISNTYTSSNFKNIIIWNRRGYMPILPVELKSNLWFNYLKNEQLPVLYSIENLNANTIIGSYKQEVGNNKILNLEIAKKCGFKIPNTIVTNNKDDLLNFIKKDKKYITKSLYHPPNLETEKFLYYGSGTIELDIERNFSNNFAQSLVQEYIEKSVEIRVFFIENFFFSMAIFSQNDDKTKIDFRNYNTEMPNRYVPFLLPINILEKTKKFIKIGQHNTGSIDLILTPEGDFVFLEINPMGQYDWVSQYCNYYIDKKIAEILIQKSAKL